MSETKTNKVLKVEKTRGRVFTRAPHTVVSDYLRVERHCGRFAARRVNLVLMTDTPEKRLRGLVVY